MVSSSETSALGHVTGGGGHVAKNANHLASMLLLRASLDFGFPSHVLSMVHGSGSVTPEIYAKMFEPSRGVPLSFSGLQWQDPCIVSLQTFALGVSQFLECSFRKSNPS